MFENICNIATLLGLTFTIYQLYMVKKIAIETQRELNRIDTLVDIGKCNEIIKDITFSLKNYRLDHVLSKLREVKDMIVKFKVYLGKLDDYRKLDSHYLEEIDYHLNILQGSINDIERNYKDPKTLNTMVIGENFDKLSTFIVEIQAHLSIKINQ